MLLSTIRQRFTLPVMSVLFLTLLLPLNTLSGTAFAKSKPGYCPQAKLCRFATAPKTAPPKPPPVPKIASHKKPLPRKTSQFTVTSDTTCHVSQSLHFFYAQAYQCYTGTGIVGSFSQHQPFLDTSNDAHSLAELAIKQDFSNGFDALEEGWTVSPIQFNNNTSPHLFLFRTILNQDKGGCYVLDSTDKNGCGWVQYSSTLYPGMEVTVTTDPQLYAILYYQGNWWVWYQSEWIGYFPANIWPNNRFTQFTWAGWWGEVSSLSSSPCSQMGDGIFGTQPGSAVIDNMGFFTSDGSATTANAQSNVTNQYYYDVGNFTGSSFNYGGPGAC